MPVYEYRCNACQREFEYQQKMSDDDLVTCEACGEDKLEKLISWSAFRLGGMGDASWTKQINGKMTAEQQRDVARSLVDKGAPPKREKPKTGDASTDASATPPAPASASASPPAEAAPAPEAALDPATEAPSSAPDGDKP